jgi:hypothetical protein
MGRLGKPPAEAFSLDIKTIKKPSIAKLEAIQVSLTPKF